MCGAPRHVNIICNKKMIHHDTIVLHFFEQGTVLSTVWANAFLQMCSASISLVSVFFVKRTAESRMKTVYDWGSNKDLLSFRAFDAVEFFHVQGDGIERVPFLKPSLNNRVVVCMITSKM